MPNTREKLIELLDEAEEWADRKCDKLECENCPADKMKGNCVQQLMVDRLIANGVRLEEKQATSDETSKWISVKDRLPENGAVVLGYMVSRDYRTIKWKNNTHRWEGILIDYEKDFVTHWIPLPEPPKGE